MQATFINELFILFIFMAFTSIKNNRHHRIHMWSRLVWTDIFNQVKVVKQQVLTKLNTKINFEE